MSGKPLLQHLEDISSTKAIQLMKKYHLNEPEAGLERTSLHEVCSRLNRLFIAMNILLSLHLIYQRHFLDRDQYGLHEDLSRFLWQRRHSLHIEVHSGQIFP